MCGGGHEVEQAGVGWQQALVCGKDTSCNLLPPGHTYMLMIIPCAGNAARIVLHKGVLPKE